LGIMTGFFSKSKFLRILTVAGGLSFLLVIFTPPTSVSALSSTSTVTITGHGWGHAVGMCQYGAKGMADAGYTYDQILAHYYQGTTLEAGSVPEKIKVGLLTKQSEISVTCAGIFYIYDGVTSIATANPGDAWKVNMSAEGKYQVIKSDGTLLGAYAGPIVFKSASPGSNFLQLPQKVTYSHFRGDMIVQSLTDGLAAINELPFEKYLYGVVPSEMPSGWSAEALKAQACAARNYAFKNIGKHGNYDLCASTHCQVYLGHDHEAVSTNAAVDATAGKLIMSNGSPIMAYYHSTCGGSTENSEDVWSAALPYCRAVSCPYCTSSSYRDWSVTYTVAELEEKLNANPNTQVPGTLIGLEITSTRGPRRVGYVKIVGTDGEIEVTGSLFKSVLGLRSTWFVLSQYTDLSSIHWAYSYIEYLTAQGVISGYQDGTFQPSNNIKRAEFAKVICEAQGWDLLDPEILSFPDVSKTHWAYQYIETAKANGAIGGYIDGTFKPGSDITRAEISKMISTASALSLSSSETSFPDVFPTHWAYKYIIACENNKIIGGYEDGTFRPGNNANRAEVSSMIYKMLGF